MAQGASATGKTGLNLAVQVAKTGSAVGAEYSVEGGEVKDEGDGAYSVVYCPSSVGSYALIARFTYQQQEFVSGPVAFEVVRDGEEGIRVNARGTSHVYEVVEDWDEMLTSLDAQGIECTRDGEGAFSRTGMGDDPRFARREDSGEYYTYVHDPDGNLIELVHHPMGLVDVRGNPVAVTKDPEGLRWRQLPEVEQALGKA